MLDIGKWKKFYYKDLFKIHGSTTTKLDDLIEYGEGEYPYVTTQAGNNGVAGFYNYYTEEGNCLVVDSAVLGTCTYQKNNFSASDHVEVLEPKFKLTDNIAFFLCTLINMEQYKYSYGRKRSQTKLKDEYLLLPVDSDGKPDWEFMDSYIEKLENLERESKGSLKDALRTNGSYNEICKENWKDYRLGDLFDKVYKSTSYVKQECEELFENEGINFVSRTEDNNGCDTVVEKNEGMAVEKGNALIIGDTTSTIFYQEKEFVTGDHIVVCRSKWLNRYTALFVKSILEKERFRYSYGRAFIMESINNTIIPLPTKNDEPDWNYMETFIKSLPYGDRI